MKLADRFTSWLLRRTVPAAQQAGMSGATITDQERAAERRRREVDELHELARLRLRATAGDDAVDR